MATVIRNQTAILNQNETFLTSNEDDVIRGRQDGSEVILIQDGVAGIETNAEIERADLPVGLNALNFQVSRNGLEISNNSETIITIPSLNQDLDLRLEEGNVTLSQTGAQEFTLTNPNDSSDTAIISTTTVTAPNIGLGDNFSSTIPQDGLIEGTSNSDTITPQALAPFTTSDLNETIRAGDGDDTVDGAGGSDSILGGNGNDKLNGSDSNDELNAGLGADTIFGSAGNDTITGGDTLSGAENRDELNYSELNAPVTITPPNFVVKGANGELGTDEFAGEFDVIVADPDFGDPSSVNNVNTIDADNVTGNNVNINIDLSANTLQTNAGGNTAFQLEIENFVDVFGTGNGDRIIGNNQANTLNGNDGNDTLNGGDDSGTIVTQAEITIAKSGTIEGGDEVSVDIGNLGTATATFSGDQDASGVAQALASAISGLSNNVNANANSEIITVSNASGQTNIEPSNLSKTDANNSFDISGSTITDTQQTAGGGSDDQLTGGAGDDDFLFVEDADFGDTIIDFSTSGATGDDEVVLDVDTNPNTANGALFTLEAAGANTLNVLSGTNTNVNSITGAITNMGSVFTRASLDAIISALTNLTDSSLSSGNNENFIAFGLDSSAPNAGRLFGFQIAPDNNNTLTAGEITTATIADLNGVTSYSGGDIFIA